MTRGHGSAHYERYIAEIKPAEVRSAGALQLRRQSWHLIIGCRHRIVQSAAHSVLTLMRNFALRR